MDQKEQMIEQWQSGRYSKAELARRFGVSRTTMYEWIGQFSACGCGGLAERSRAPRSQPHKTSPDVVAQIVGLRSQLPHRGAKKRKAIGEREHSRRPWPAASTVAGIPRQQGLTVGPPAAAAGSTQERAAGACRGAECVVVRRLQGLVFGRQRGALRAVDVVQCWQPLLVALSVAVGHELRAGETSEGSGFPRVWIAASAAHRQGATVGDVGRGRIVAAGGMVGEAGDHPGED